MVRHLFLTAEQKVSPAGPVLSRPIPTSHRAAADQLQTDRACFTGGNSMERLKNGQFGLDDPFSAGAVFSRVSISATCGQPHRSAESRNVPSPVDHRR
jgi:hypothetical protein